MKPEDEWWTRDGIQIGPATDSEDEHESGSVADLFNGPATDSEDEHESGSVSDLFNGQESGSDSVSDHDEKSGLVTCSGDEQEPAS